jgi:hypothetical protein
VKAVSDNGVYPCLFVEIAESYNIVNPASLIAYFRTQPQQATGIQPAYNAAAIAYDVANVKTKWHFSEGGATTVFQELKFLMNGYLGSFYGLQMSTLGTPGGGSIWDWFPKTKSPSDYTTAPVAHPTSGWLSFDAATRWADANNPPERFVQFTKTSGGSFYFGMCMGYNPKIGGGRTANRALTAVNSAVAVTAGKIYAACLDGSNQTQFPRTNYCNAFAGDQFDLVCYRFPLRSLGEVNSLYNPSNPDTTRPTELGWYYVGGDCYLNVAFHASFKGTIALPEKLFGRQIEVLESQGTIAVKSGYVGRNGIAVSVTTFGAAVLKIY